MAGAARDVAAGAAAGAAAAGAAVERPFLPWVLPLAAGLTLGVALAALRPVLVLPVGGGGLIAAAGWRGRVRPTAPDRRLRGAAVLVAVGLLAGGARMALWLARPDRVAPLLGSQRVLRGYSDGRVVRLQDPAGLRLALTPAASVPPGWVTLRGTVERAPGRRNPGGFDYRGYLARRGIEGEVHVTAVLRARPDTSVLERFRRGVTRGLGPAQAALMEAMTLGVRDRLGSLRQRFAAAGLAHVLALSGLHVGVLVAALGRALAGLGRRRLPLLAAATAAYVALVGPSPSVLRAALMVLAGLAGLASGHGRLQAWPALALAATGSLLLAPAQLLDASFQLSYLAVAGMLLFAPVLARPLLRGVPQGRGGSARRWLATALAASVAAQLPSLSLVAGSFGRLPLLSPLVNLAAVPLAGVLVPLGFLAALVGLVAPWAALALNAVVGPLASLLLALASWGEALPHLVWGDVAPLGHACFAVALVALAAAAKGRLRPWRAVLVVLCAGTVSAAVPPARAAPEVVFLDVGQGDATLVRLPGRVEVLIDGGGTPFGDRDVGAEVVLPALRALGVRALDVVVASHPDLDHVEGLLSVLERVPVGTLVMGPAWPEATIDRQLRALARERGVAVHRAVRGERLRLTSVRSAAELEVLHPGWRARPTPNENSIALLLRYRGTPQLLMLGDAPASVEAELALPRVPVVKLAHHGSRYSTSEALLRAAAPRLAIVSVGRNRYGHPDAGVLERLAQHGVAVASTRSAGALRLPLAQRGPGPAVPTEQDGIRP